MNVKVITPSTIFRFTEVNVPAVVDGGALLIRRTPPGTENMPFSCFDVQAGFAPGGWLRWERE